MSAITENKQGLKVLITGSIVQLFLGIIYVWSVFVAPVSDIYNWDINGVKLTSSFMLCFFVIGILFGGRMLPKIGAGNVVLIGGLVLAAGMFTTAFLPAGELAWLMYITYGIIGGFGVGAGYNASLTAAQKWFPQNRGFATGISACAFGFSTVLFAPLVEKLVSQFDLRSTFMILAAAFMVITLALFRFIRLPDESGAAGAPSAALLAKKQFTIKEMIKAKEFYFLAFSLMFATSVFFVLNPSFKTFAAERGLSASLGTIIVMMTGIANALGRLGTPLLSDKIGREKATIIIISVTAVGAVFLCFANGFLFMATIAVIAFCFGGLPGVYPVLTADYFGIKNVGSNYGAVMMGFALSALTFPVLIGLIEATIAKFIVLAAVAVLGVLLVFMLMVSGKKS